MTVSKWEEVYFTEFGRASLLPLAYQECMLDMFREQHLRRMRPFPQWPLLPVEIQHSVFDLLATDENDTNGRRLRRIDPTKAGLARYSVVCKEWQAFFERKLYRHLTVGHDCLFTFQNLAWRISSLVEYIEFRIELDRYKCGVAAMFTDSRDADINNKRVADAINHLFLILSNWGTPAGSSKKVGLEICVYSPSDSEHFFGTEFCITANKESRNDGLDCWNHLCDSSKFERLPPPALSIYRVLEQARPVFKGRLPSVHIVKSLFIYRKFRRTLSAPCVQQILESLPNIEVLHYEPWREVRCDYHEGLYKPSHPSRDTDYSEMLAAVWPKKLKTLTIFEDFSEVYNIFIHYQPNFSLRPSCNTQVELFRTTTLAASEQLARRSLDLEHLSASYMVDAYYFFRACESGWVWPSLKTLTLTSIHLYGESDPWVIDEMLQWAGEVAIAMPKLELMELWFAMQHNAFVFRYRVVRGVAEVSWSGAWDLELNPEVLSYWNWAAAKHTDKPCWVIPPREKLIGCNIGSHGEAIDRLGLSKQVVHASSLDEIKAETENMFQRFQTRYADWVREGCLRPP